MECDGLRMLWFKQFWSDVNEEYATWNIFDCVMNGFNELIHKIDSSYDGPFEVEGKRNGQWDGFNGLVGSSDG